MIEKIGDILMQTRLPDSDKTRKKTRRRKFYLWKFFFDIVALLCLHVDIDALLYCYIYAVVYDNDVYLELEFRDLEICSK